MPGIDGYDEFSMLADNAAEVGLAFTPPSIRRTSVTAASGLEVSALVWGDAPPELVLLHGGAQNAHTWDTVALALDRPLVAIDLPGHGHSAWRPERDYRPQAMAVDIVSVVDALAPDATTLWACRSAASPPWPAWPKRRAWPIASCWSTSHRGSTSRRRRPS